MREHWTKLHCNSYNILLTYTCILDTNLRANKFKNATLNRKFDSFNITNYNKTLQKNYFSQDID